LREEAALGEVDLGAFYWRRVFRILPPAYTALTLAVTGGALGLLPNFAWSAVSACVFQFTNFWMIHHGTMEIGGGLGPYWSLAVEEHFYLLFPVLFVWLGRRIPRTFDRGLVLLGGCGLVLGWRLLWVLTWIWTGHVDGVHLLVGTDTRIDSILFGCAMAMMANPVLDPLVLPDRVLRWVVTPVALAVLGFTLTSSSRIGWGLNFTLQGLALWPLFTLAISQDRWWPMRILNNPAVAFAGVLSYSFYLVHLPILTALERYWPRGNPALAAVALPMSFALAWMLFRFVEVPARTARNRFLSRRTRQAALATT
jgi:peptidoglycan/LPS O-acetylase OafA/YrhL